MTILLPKDYRLVEARLGELDTQELCWRERKLLVGSPKRDRSKG